MKGSIKTFIVDSFTNERFKGNPAGVCILESDLDDATMLAIAYELNLSETAFVKKEDQGAFSIRYFSPKMEIPLCGHATLAAAKVLFNKHSDLKKLNFTTVEKLDLPISKIGHSMSMQFPAYQIESIDTPKKLVKALGISHVLYSGYNAETNIILLEIEKADELKSLIPNYYDLLASHDEINGVLITAQSDHSDYDFMSRYFWPWSGTMEDPVTGGTHTFLAPYWSKKLKKTELRSFQCSERTGKMTVRIKDHNNLVIEGEATIFLEGHIDQDD